MTLYEAYRVIAELQNYAAIDSASRKRVSHALSIEATTDNLRQAKLLLTELKENPNGK